MATRSRTRTVARRQEPPPATEPAPSRYGARRNRNRSGSSPVRPRSAGDEPATEDDGTLVVTVTETTQLPLKTDAPPRSPGALSGTTARTSLNSAHGGEMDKVDDLVDNLMRLNDAAGAMLDLMAPKKCDNQTLANVGRKFREGTGAAGRLLPGTRRSFKAVWQTYGGPAPTINADQVLHDLFQSEDGPLPEQRWRPDDVLFKANLAKACEDVFDSSSEGSYDMQWDKLNREFPEPFLRRIDPHATELGYGTSRLSGPTFRVALGLRTQFALSMLQDVDDSSAEDFLEEVFGSDEQPQGWEVEGLRAQDLTNSQIQAILANKQMLTRGADSQTQGAESAPEFVSEDVSKLFPTTVFVCDYIKWIRARAEEIEIFLESVGKVPGIQEAIEDHFQQAQSTELPAQRVYYLATDRKRASAGNSAASEQLLTPTARAKLQLQHRKKPVRASAPTPGAFAELNSVEFDEPAEEHLSANLANTSDVPLLSREERRDFIAMHRGQEAEANKENSDPAVTPAQRRQQQRQSRFIEAQPDRERVEFEDTQPDRASPSGANMTLSSRTENGGESSTDPSQDVGFEHDDRQQTRSRKRAAAHNVSPPAKRSRMANPEGSLSAINVKPRQPTPLSSSAAPSVVPAPTQAAVSGLRRAWTAEEVAYLEAEIGRLGCSWARIKAEDHSSVLRLRDQVSLKDKARNLRVEYLRSGRAEMPKNFVQIPLKASDRQLLARMGIPELCLMTIR